MGDPKVLLVEGKDDQRVLEVLAEKRRLPKVRVYSNDGVEPLLQRLPLHWETSYGDLEGLGVVVDADDDPQRAYRRVADKLASIDGLAPPAVLPERGLVLDHRGYRVGVWVMPGNDEPGAMERLLYATTPSGDRAMEAAADFVRGVGAPRREDPQAAQRWLDKAQLRAWLAVQPKPGLSLAAALEAGLFDAQSRSFDDFVDWYQRLFVS